MIQLLQLALAFAKIGLFTLGGGMVMLPLIRAEMLQRCWLTEVQFIEILGISEATPGPLAMNCATFVGWRVAGLSGALVATFSLALPSLLLVLLFGFVWRRYQYHPGMTRVLGLLRPLLTGLILALAIRLGGAVLQGDGGELTWQAAWPSLLVAALVCVGVVRGRISPVTVLLSGALLGALIDWL